MLKRLVGCVVRRLSLALVLGGALVCAAQVPAAPPLTAEQQALFNAARKDFNEHHPELALEKMKQLHAALPENQTITDGTAETAVTVGDDAYPDDLFALELLARSYAETGSAAERDSTIAAVLKLYATTTNEKLKRPDRFLVERVKLANGSLEIYCALAPFSRYHIYMLGRQLDANNALVQQITLESDDVDQIGFAQQHPDLAAKGMRRFSMDTYSASKAGPNGTPTQTQGLAGFIDGQPSYDETKVRMLKVAQGAAPLMETRPGVPVAKPN